MKGKIITFSDVKQEQVDRVISQISVGGSVHSQGNGVYLIDSHGIKASARLDGDTLTVSVDSKPFYMSMDMLEVSIADHLEVPNEGKETE